ncbi:hypothetical protein J3Q64DRAFT_1817006 [Phycomyces blakesleeanus]|uniref:Uncharacterized protein n=2 Tax=Phycomyces blakesleeanus TaxID=4837 RepID=A0A167P6F3_PHYB8|nr:hypothetical protein PHYBLDRAFT_60469 [Phycomyces blakesleeanus NRRL 1555(-)]OAD77338.1 hypothetical protein PHYBLDRAFT_60469 [Phycomyces blakesleeanus NRRL 1555(-)]|eukprot:XP_018295378.1 hypothetical protein PHYBLDRAFT_60469 [Phycomyces blakesleeanus NRRL 1555(-)]
MILLIEQQQQQAFVSIKYTWITSPFFTSTSTSTDTNTNTNTNTDTDTSTSTDTAMVIYHETYILGIRNTLQNHLRMTSAELTRPKLFGKKNREYKCHISGFSLYMYKWSVEVKRKYTHILSKGIHWSLYHPTFIGGGNIATNCSLCKWRVFIPLGIFMQILEGECDIKKKRNICVPERIFLVQARLGTILARENSLALFVGFKEK